MSDQIQVSEAPVEAPETKQADSSDAPASPVKREYPADVVSVGKLIIEGFDGTQARARNLKIGKLACEVLRKQAKHEKFVDDDFNAYCNNVAEFIKDTSSLNKPPRVDDFVRFYVFVEVMKGHGNAKVELISYGTVVNKLVPVAMSFSKKNMVAEIKAGWLEFLGSIIDDLIGAEPPSGKELDKRIADHTAALLAERNAKKTEADLLSEAQAKAAREKRTAASQGRDALYNGAVKAMDKGGSEPSELVAELKRACEAAGKVMPESVKTVEMAPDKFIDHLAKTLTAETASQLAKALFMSGNQIAAEALADSLGKVLAFLKTQGTKNAA